MTNPLIPHEFPMTDIELIITEKMDGENTTIHRGGSHARSPDSRYHPSRDWLKAFSAGIQPQLADGERVIGENLYARHSVGYDDLPSFFLGFAWIASISSGVSIRMSIFVNSQACCLAQAVSYPIETKCRRSERILRESVALFRRRLSEDIN